MSRGRLEAFSDGVIAIIITVMVLEMHAPHSADLSALKPLLPVFLSYVMSYVYLGIYWSNHHHLFQLVKRVSGPILWANLHLLFWLSLVPFVTGWMGENSFRPLPVMLYGIVLLCAAIAYYILTLALLRQHGRDSLLAQAIKYGLKERISIALYVMGIVVAIWFPLLVQGVFALVAIIWLVPDRRVERTLAQIKPEPDRHQEPD